MNMKEMNNDHNGEEQKRLRTMKNNDNRGEEQPWRKSEKKRSNNHKCNNIRKKIK